MHRMKRLLLLIIAVTRLLPCLVFWTSLDAPLSEAALQVVTYNESEYELNENALLLIERLPPPVKVLAAVGDARIGKSTFLNMVHLHWDSGDAVSDNGASDAELPFEVGSTTEVCTTGVWLHVHRLPDGGSLVLVDVEGANLGNDVVTEQLSAFTAVMSSYILLFVREVVNNPALEFIYHVAKLGNMFPNSDHFPHLGVAIRDALDLSSKFTDRKSEVVDALTSSARSDNNNKLREEIAKQISPNQISAFEIEYQNRKELENLQMLKAGPYYDSALQIINNLKNLVPAKVTPNGMEMCGGDLVVMIRKLFDALGSGDIKALATAYDRLEAQMCDEHYTEWIQPLMRMSEEDFMSKMEHHVEQFRALCKINSHIDRVQDETSTRSSMITQERKIREERRKAEEEKRKAELEKIKAEEARKKAEEDRKLQEQLRKEAELKKQREEEERRRIEEQAARDRARAAEEQRKAAEAQRQLQERLRREQEERRKAEQRVKEENCKRRCKKKRRRKKRKKCMRRCMG